jgi:diguanylate cyclase (GGDEF)-like protein
MDGLTQVLNARAFKGLVSIPLEMANRHQHSTTFCYIDLDNFKAVNDSLGHHVGDYVLKIVATTLNRCVRTTDAVGRLGGDEFIIFMPESGDKEAQIAITRIHEELMKNMAAHDWPIGFSIGVAVFPSPSQA